MMASEKPSAEKKWIRLDNAAKIYPASQSRTWMALFRLSANLTEPIVPEILQAALKRTLRRFPAFSRRLRNGVFWNYLEYIDGTPTLQEDVQNPCVHMDFEQNGGFMFRVRYYSTRIAVEFFHVLTDGTGGLCFLKTLVAEYLTLKYGVAIPRSNEILNCDAAPEPEESEDHFLKYARVTSPRSRKESAAFRIPGTPIEHFMCITTGIIDTKPLLALAKSYKATLTELLTAVLIQSIDAVQTQAVPARAKHKPIKICVPVNLRKYYGTNTIRNFASYTNPGIEPKYGKYTFEEIINAVHGHMLIESNEKLLNAKFSTNVLSERNPFLRVAPLFIKMRAMRLVFRFKGDRQTSSSISNLGATSLPAEMAQYVTRMDFMLGPLSRNRVACACLSYKGKLIFNFTRTIEEADVERNFFTALIKMGIPVMIESNQQGR